MRLLDQYAPVLFGLAMGMVAHFGFMLSERNTPTIKDVLGYLMMLGVIGLMATVATKVMGLTDPDMRALVAAILAISAQEVIRHAKRRGWQPLLGQSLPGGSQPPAPPSADTPPSNPHEEEKKP